MAISQTLYSSKTDLWETPQELFDSLNQEFHFDLDVCAIPENAKCDEFYTPEQDGLVKPWIGTCWCNPPYGRDVGKWVEKAARTADGSGERAYPSGARNVVCVRVCEPDINGYGYGKTERRC